MNDKPTSVMFFLLLFLTLSMMTMSRCLWVACWYWSVFRSFWTFLISASCPCSCPSSLACYSSHMTTMWPYKRTWITQLLRNLFSELHQLFLLLLILPRANKEGICRICYAHWKTSQWQTPGTDLVLDFATGASAPEFLALSLMFLAGSLRAEGYPPVHVLSTSQMPFTLHNKFLLWLRDLEGMLANFGIG